MIGKDKVLVVSSEMLRVPKKGGNTKILVLPQIQRKHNLAIISPLYSPGLISFLSLIVLRICLFTSLNERMRKPLVRVSELCYEFNLRTILTFI